MQLCSVTNDTFPSYEPSAWHARDLNEYHDNETKVRMVADNSYRTFETMTYPVL